MTKRVLRKTTSAIFLAIVLVAGTITLLYPSFIVGAQATSDGERYYDDDKNGSYEKDTEYGYEYAQEDNTYNEQFYPDNRYYEDENKYKKDFLHFKITRYSNRISIHLLLFFKYFFNI